MKMDRGLGGCKEWRFHSEWDREKPVLTELRKAAAACGLRADRIEDLVSAAAEACLNAAEHGNIWKVDKYVTVRMCLNASRIRIRVYDEGQGADIDLLTCRRDGVDTLEGNARGWGVMLMKGLADELHFGRDESGFYSELIFRVGEGRMSDG
jgi:anti-sigma regulatory factor (Ser/Thr protein kinase)